MGTSMHTTDEREASLAPHPFLIAVNSKALSRNPRALRTWSITPINRQEKLRFRETGTYLPKLAWFVAWLRLKSILSVQRPVFFVLPHIYLKLVPLPFFSCLSQLHSPWGPWPEVGHRTPSWCFWHLLFIIPAVGNHVDSGQSLPSLKRGIRFKKLSWVNRVGKTSFLAFCMKALALLIDGKGIAIGSCI